MARTRFTCYAVPIPASDSNSRKERSTPGRSLTLNQTSNVRPGDEHVVVVGGQAAAERRERLAQGALDRVALRPRRRPGGRRRSRGGRRRRPPRPRRAGTSRGPGSGSRASCRRGRRGRSRRCATAGRAFDARSSARTYRERRRARGRGLDHRYGVRRLRPLARRRRMTSRPERVRIRARNPWVRARLRFFGCQVRFIGSASLQTGLVDARPLPEAAPGFVSPRIAGWAAGARGAGDCMVAGGALPAARRRSRAALARGCARSCAGRCRATTFSLWLEPRAAGLGAGIDPVRDRAGHRARLGRAPLRRTRSPRRCGAARRR